MSDTNDTEVLVLTNTPHAYWVDAIRESLERNTSLDTLKVANYSSFQVAQNPNLCVGYDVVFIDAEAKHVAYWSYDIRRINTKPIKIIATYQEERIPYWLAILKWLNIIDDAWSALQMVEHMRTFKL